VRSTRSDRTIRRNQQTDQVVGLEHPDCAVVPTVCAAPAVVVVAAIDAVEHFVFVEGDRCPQAGSGRMVDVQTVVRLPATKWAHPGVLAPIAQLRRQTPWGQWAPWVQQYGTDPAPLVPDRNPHRFAGKAR